MYNQYSLTNQPALSEVLIALLAQAGFDSFQETEDGLLAFGATQRHSDWEAVLDDLAGRFGFSYSYASLPNKNWNAEWESQFPPLAIGNQLYIRADFHDPNPNIPFELIITPKMAFGTGHHATTHMMCELLFTLHVPGTRVLDYGSGTGVLAILAKKLGAAEVDAVDIEAPSAENTAENATRNDVQLDEIILGELPDVPAGRPYDLILANINRNVILATAGALYERLKTGGTVLFSGILATDEELLRTELTKAGFRHQTTRRRDDWRAYVFTK